MMKGWPPGPIKYGKAMILYTKNERISKFVKIFVLNVKNKTIKIYAIIILKNCVILTEVLLTSKSNRTCVFCFDFVLFSTCAGLVLLCLTKVSIFCYDV